MYGYIYKTTNLINNKIYIGKKVSKKYLGTAYLGSGKLIKRAIEKYGKENFQVEQLNTANTKEKLNELEKFYISYYNSTNREIGYNISIGGDGGDTVSNLTDEEKTIRNNKISKANKGKIVVNNGQINKNINPEDLDIYLENGFVLGVTAEAHENIANASRNRPHPINSGNFKQGIPTRKGILHTEETKQQISKTLTGHKRSVDSRLKQSNTMKLQYASGEKVSYWKGKHSYNSGQKGILTCYNNGIINKMIKVGEVPPNGFIKGKLTTRKPAHNKGKECYTNGINNIYIKIGDLPPEGYYKGRKR